MKIISVLLGVLAISTVLAEQPQKLERVEVFSGPLNLQRPQVSKVDVAIQVWTLRGQEKYDSLEIPGKGTLVVQLRAGSLTTVIGGKRQERKEGEFWTVPSGVVMGVETSNDSAILQTVLIRE